MARPYKADPELTEIIEKAEKAKAEGNEAQLKELKKKLKQTAQICGAVQGSGRICSRKPKSDNGRCHIHGGYSTGAKTKEGREKALANLNPKAKMIHGIYSRDFKSNLTQEEVEMYNFFMDWFFEKYEESTDPVNLTLFDRFIMNKIKQARRDSIDFLNDAPSYNDFEVKLIRFAESMGLNRKFKESKENKDNSSGVDISLLFSDNE